nr:Chain B, PRR [Homo sapiens]
TKGPAPNPPPILKVW